MNSNKTNTNTNTFYMENNYDYFNDSEYYKTYNLNKYPELPEWYHTERDQDIVCDICYEYDIFFDPTKSIEQEIREPKKINLRYKDNKIEVLKNNIFN